MARPRKLNTTKKESNEEKLQREGIKTELENFTKIQTTVPKVLKSDRIASSEYRRLRPLLEELPISNLDLNLLIVYCQLYSIYRQLQKEMEDEGLIIETYYATGELKERKINAASHELLKYSKELRAIAGMLGLSIDSRMRLIDHSVNEKENDPFANMFEGE